VVSAAVERLAGVGVIGQPADRGADGPDAGLIVHEAAC
jgi:hypothetical protein